MNHRRLFCSSRTWLLLSVGAALTIAGGCKLLAEAAWVLKGDDIKAQYAGLVGKRVVVVCRPPADLHFRNGSAARELAKQVTAQLKANVRKIDMVDNKQVAAWTDENTWEAYSEVGQAFKADMVVGIELDQFSLQQGSTLYQGRANLKLTVYDVANADVVFEKPAPPITFPNTPFPSYDMQEEEFRRQFIGVLADRIAREFYDHDARAGFATDAEVLH